MSTRVAVTTPSILRDPATFKKAALLFDRIAVVFDEFGVQVGDPLKPGESDSREENAFTEVTVEGLTQRPIIHRIVPPNAALAADLEWLMERDLVIDALAPVVTESGETFDFESFHLTLKRPGSSCC